MSCSQFKKRKLEEIDKLTKLKSLKIMDKFVIKSVKIVYEINEEPVERIDVLDIHAQNEVDVSIDMEVYLRNYYTIILIKFKLL